MIPPSTMPSRGAKQNRISDRAMERLAGAVLIQAIQDASNGPRSVREEALAWINGKTTDGLTFKLCCNILGRDPGEVRVRLQKNFYIPKEPLGPEYARHSTLAFEQAARWFAAQAG